MAEFHAEWLPDQVGQWSEKGVSGGTDMQPLYGTTVLSIFCCSGQVLGDPAKGQRG